MKLMAAVALACGFVAAPMVGAGSAAALPGSCDGADCVTYVDRSAALGDSCAQNTRYNLGIDASGNTLACGSQGAWITAPPLVGMRVIRSQCGEDTGIAQSADGITLSCQDGAWSPDYSAPFYRR